jgi:hypothetical protein
MRSFRKEETIQKPPTVFRSNPAPCDRSRSNECRAADHRREVSTSVTTTVINGHGRVAVGLAGVVTVVKIVQQTK